MRSDLDFWTQFASVFTEKWRSQAVCIDMNADIFFEEGYEEQAQRICSQCPVFYDCLEDALYYDDSEGHRALSQKERDSISMHRKRTIKAFKCDLGILDE